VYLQTILLVTIAVSLVFVVTPLSDAVLWDLIISAEPSKPIYDKNEGPIIFGKIVNHAYKPTVGAEVKIRFGSESVLTKTDYDGMFHYEFEEKTRTPGRYVVNIIANDPHDGKIGLTSTTLKIRGTAIDILSAEEPKIEFAEDIDFEKDPIAAILFKHQQEKAAEREANAKKLQELKQYQELLDENRRLADKSLQEVLEAQNPEASNYIDTWHYERFVANLDLSVKDIFLGQFNYTTKIWSEAQLAMNNVLESGGTWLEARQVYFEKAAISQQIMERFTLQNNMTEISTINGTEIKQTNNTKG